MAQKGKRSLSDYIAFAIIFPSVFAVVVLALIFAFSLVNSIINSNILLIIIIALSSILFIGICAYLLFAVPKIHDFFYKVMYKTTKENFNNILDMNKGFTRYPGESLRELDDLNKDLDSLYARLTMTTLVSKGLNYDIFPLVKYKDMERVYTLKSFKENIQSLVFAAYNYRNVIVEIYYDFIEDKELDEDNIKHLIDLLESTFVGYEDHCIAVNENNKSVLIYLPYINSFSRIKEQLTCVLDDFSISVRTNDGIQLLPAKAAIVAYPYSDVDELFHDLRYAKNTTEVIHLYLPQRMLQSSSDNIKTSTSNLNIVSKVCESLGRLVVGDNKKSLKIISDGIKEFCLYINADIAGLILFDKDTKTYISKASYSKETFSLFQEENVIDGAFIQSLQEEMDFDKSYYFSRRANANTNIGRHLDRYDIDSGFYYVAEDKGQVIGVVYFFNKKKEMQIDSYVREGLVLFSSKVGDFIIRSEKNKSVLESYEEIDSVLELTDYATYKIDKHTHNIIGFSNNLKQYFPNVEEKQPCYKCIYGLDRPCTNCPLITGKTSTSKCNGRCFETSLKLINNNSSRYVRLLLRNMPNEDDNSNRFHKDLLINSFAALKEDLTNAYSINTKGHLLLLRFDNLDELLTKHDSESLLVAMRHFVKNVKEIEYGLQNIYYFNPQCIAVLFKETGQIDVVDRCEKIYAESKKNYFDEWNEGSFNITYLPIAYPAGYPLAGDFIKHTMKFFQTNKDFAINKDVIYLEENDYQRPASRRDFMLDVIDDKFGNKTFNALLQPYVVAEDRKVFGAEMLLRLTDDYRKIVFNADELIKIAAANGKITLISDALIDYIGDLYIKQGSSIFKVFGLKRISINTDFSYFQDEEAVNKLVEDVAKYNFPRGFLGLEIAEWELKNHYSSFQAIADKLINAGMTLICDQFSGRDISIEKLKELKVSEIKVGRSIGGFLDSDPQKCQAFTTIVETAKALGMQISVVGIENNDQYEIVKKLDHSALLQGFYFFKPLDKNALVNALRNNNVGGN